MLHFEPSLDALSVWSDVKSSIKSLSLVGRREVAQGASQPCLGVWRLRFRVRGLGFGLRDVGFRGQGFGFSWDSGFRVMGLG